MLLMLLKKLLKLPIRNIFNKLAKIYNGNDLVSGFSLVNLTVNYARDKISDGIIK